MVTQGSPFMIPIKINFEYKPLFPGNIGPATGEMGTCMYCSGPNKLFSATLAKLKDRLAEEGYVGYIDVNCIVNGNAIGRPGVRISRIIRRKPRAGRDIE
jgi:phosphoribosylamine--glycine ligase